MRVQLWGLPRRPRANFNETLAELRSAPPEEMAESKDEQYEEIDPRDISRCVMVGWMMMKTGRCEGR